MIYTVESTVYPLSPSQQAASRYESPPSIGMSYPVCWKLSTFYVYYLCCTSVWSGQKWTIETSLQNLNHQLCGRYSQPVIEAFVPAPFLWLYHQLSQKLPHWLQFKIVILDLTYGVVVVDQSAVRTYVRLQWEKTKNSRSQFSITFQSWFMILML